MKKIVKLVVVRWLSRTPIGLALLGLGWWFGRKNRDGQRHPSGRRHDRRRPRRTARRLSRPHARRGTRR